MATAEAQRTPEGDPENVVCPQDGCEYESSEQGVKIHYGRSHTGTISGVMVECANCGTETRKPEYKLDRSENLFCGPDCHAEWTAENVSGEAAGGWSGGEVEVECEWCGNTKTRPRCRVDEYDHHFCNRGCYTEWMNDGGALSGEDNPLYGVTGDDHPTAGENNPFFGVTGEDHPAWKGGHDGGWRRSDDGTWRRTARKVYDRDGYVCQKCSENGELHAHHITPVSNGGAKYNMNNLITLCKDCHGEVHSADYNGDLIKRGE